MAEPQDTEITLGTGRLLTMFFGLVVVGAVLFGLGYGMGKSAARQASVAEGVTLPAPMAAASKPTAGRPGAAVDCAANPQACPPGSSELTFFKAVEQKEANAELAPQPAASVAEEEPSAAAPEIPRNGTPGYLVQVAAVSKQEDAEALVNALRQKQYQVFVVTNPAVDRLFHVQMGPFGDAKEAEAIRVRLMSDGYNPIVKR